MYGQIKLSTCSCVEVTFDFYFLTKQLDTCTVYNVHVVALVITHSRTCTMYHQIFFDKFPSQPLNAIYIHVSYLHQYHTFRSLQAMFTKD